MVCGTLVACLLIVLVIVSTVALCRKKHSATTNSTQPEEDSGPQANRTDTNTYSVDCNNVVCDSSTHLPSDSPSQSPRPEATLTQTPAHIKTADVPVKTTNEIYDVTANPTYTKTPDIPVNESYDVTTNPAYIKTPDIPVETNQSYGATSSASQDPNELYSYAITRGEEESITTEAQEYHYIIV